MRHNSTEVNNEIDLTDENLVEEPSDLEKSPIAEEVKEENADAQIPDGGFKAYLNLFGAFCGLTACMGIVNSNGTVQEYVSSKVLPHDSQTNIGWIFSLFNFCTFGNLIFVGPLFELLGSRICLGVGMGFFALGYMSLSESKHLYQFILSSIAAGFGMSFVFGTNVGLIGQYFKKKRAFCLGMAFSGGALGGIVFPIVMRSLFPKVGFGWGIRTVALIMLFLMLINWAITNDRCKELTVIDKDTSFLRKTVGRIQIKCFKSVTFSVLALCMMVNSFTFMITLTYIVSYAVAAGYSYNTATDLTIIMNATSIFGRSFSGYVADKYGRFNTLCCICLANVFCYFVLWMPHKIAHTYGGLVAFSALYGITLGSNISLGPSAVGQISHSSEFTSRYGTSSMCTSLLNLAGLPVGGAIIGSKTLKEFDNLVVFIGCLSLVALVASFICRYRLAGFSFTWI